jgi:L-lysine exporter family protein LysE/ArgO
VFWIALIYILIDICLITLGALGIGSLIADAPPVRLAFAFVAVAFFTIYGALSIYRSFQPGSGGLRPVLGLRVYSTAVLISVANPGVLFDTIVLIGGLAGQYQDLSERLAFSTGAATASIIWFTSLSLFSYHASRFVTGPRVWRYIDFVIGSLMLVIGYVIAKDAIILFRAL